VKKINKLDGVMLPAGAFPLNAAFGVGLKEMGWFLIAFF